MHAHHRNRAVRHARGSRGAALAPHPRPGINWTVAIVAGLLGSFVGGLLVSLLAGDGLALRPSGMIGSIVGAILVTLVWSYWQGRQRKADLIWWMIRRTRSSEPMRLLIHQDWATLRCCCTPTCISRAQTG